MTIKKLKEQLESFPDNMEVLLTDPDGEFEYKPLEEMIQINIRWSEGHEGKPEAFEEVLVLGED